MEKYIEIEIDIQYTYIYISIVYNRYIHNLLRHAIYITIIT